MPGPIFNYTDLKIDRISEIAQTSQPGFGLAIEIEESQVKSFTSDLSVSVSKAFSNKWGVLIPRVSARWVHEFENGDEQLFGRFLADTSSIDFQQSGVVIGDTRNGSTIFTIPLENVDSNYGNISIGATALLPNQFSVNLSVSETIGLSNLNHRYVSIALRRDFQ